MTATLHTAETAKGHGRPAAGGFTLLEVLVALGIIIGALAGIAALLPALGTRLLESVQIDRGATMIANARADLMNRGLISTAIWTSGASAIVFGEGLTSGGASTIPNIAAANASEVSLRINPATGFHLRDVVETTVTGTTVITGTGYVPGVCYGCMLSSTIASPSPGATVRMTTIAFRKAEPSSQEFSLRFLATGVYETAATPATQRRFLSGCTWVLIVGAGEPRWFRIASSWTVSATITRLTLAGSEIPSGDLTAFGFEGLLRVDEQFVNLE